VVGSSDFIYLGNGR